MSDEASPGRSNPIRIGQRVLSRRIGLPAHGVVEAIVDPGIYFQIFTAAPSIDMGQDFPAWDAAYPKWREQPVVIVSRPVSGRREIEALWEAIPEGLQPAASGILAAYPAADLEVLD